jgi:hypothetical protein
MSFGQVCGSVGLVPKAAFYKKGPRTDRDDAFILGGV